MLKICVTIAIIGKVNLKWRQIAVTPIGHITQVVSVRAVILRNTI